MDQGRKPKAKSRRTGFAHMLNMACENRDIGRIQCAILAPNCLPDKINFLNPKKIKFCSIRWIRGDHERAALEALIKLVAWEITYGNVFEKQLNFLRIITIPASKSRIRGEKLYCQVGVNEHLYMAETCYVGDEYEESRTQEFMTFLSSIFDTTVNSINVTGPQSAAIQDFSEGALQNVFEKEAAEEFGRRVYEAGLHKSKIQEKIILTEEAVRQIQWEDEREKNRTLNSLFALNVMDVEEIPLVCSCGLGENYDIPPILHLKDHCGIRRRHDIGHIQILTVQLPGRQLRIPGSYAQAPVKPRLPTL